MAGESPQILRPIPRRTFELTPASNESSTPGSPAPEPNPNYLEPRPSNDVLVTPNRTKSILNLTSSTLFGIYSPTTFDTTSNSRDESYAFGNEPPSRRTSVESSRPDIGSTRPRTPRNHSHAAQHRLFILPLIARILVLFVFGIAYGIIITHLHDNGQVAPVKVEGIDRYDWRYFGFWGVAGIGLGSLLPWVDVLWEDKVSALSTSSATNQGGKSSSKRVSPDGSGLGADWNPVVRSIGAFVGIAFAIRKLPWQSTLQLSLTLALVNPVLWYLIDRSKPGFLLSTIVGLTGTAVLLGVNPSMVPQPAMHSSNASLKAPSQATSGSGAGESMSFDGVNIGLSTLSLESIGVGTWIASVLFCSSVCFGNIGRRLAGKSG